MISKFNVGLKSLLRQGLSEPEFYGDLVYKFKTISGMTNFSDQFMADGYAALFNCTPVDRASDSMMTRPKAIHFS